MKRCCLALICCVLMSLSSAVERISFFDSYQEPILVLSSGTNLSSEFELLMNEQVSWMLVIPR